MGEFGSRMGQWGQDLANNMTRNQTNPNVFTNYTSTTNNNFNFENPNQSHYNHNNNNHFSNPQNSYQSNTENSDSSFYLNEPRNNRTQETMNQNRSRRKNKVKKKKSKDADILLKEQGLKEYRKKNYKKALDIFNATLKIKESSILYSYIALTNFRLKKFEKSLNNIHRAIEINPNKSKYYRIKGVIDINLLRINEEIRYVRSGIDAFYQALEIENTPINIKNYKKSKKILFLIKEEMKMFKQSRFMNYLSSFENIDSVKPFFKKNYFMRDNYIPSYLKCVISLDIIDEPYITPAGISYEKDLLMESIDTSEMVKDPVTSLEFGSKQDCIPNKVLKKAIINFKKKTKISGEDEKQDWREISFQI